MKKEAKKLERKKVAIALQGGGAHGAFAWGVMDRLLEDGRFDIVGVSGTSAGGMNAASVVQGLIKGGDSEARATMRRYWEGMHALSKDISPYHNPFMADGPWSEWFKNISKMWHMMCPWMPDPMEKNHNLDRLPVFHWMQHLGNTFSPYDLNPKNINPFGDFVKDFFDFEAIRGCNERRIFLGTTHVQTGKIKIFSNADVSADVLMASACLPFLFQAVEINGEHYWDGGYIANPAIYPLIEACDTRDIIIIQLTKTHCEDLPTSHGAIVDRMKEITYNGCLVREMRAIYFITMLIDKGIIDKDKMKRLNMHLIKNEDTFKELNLSSAMNTDWDFLTMLFEEGRKTAEKWIEKNYHHVGSDHYEVSKEIFGDFVS